MNKRKLILPSLILIGLIFFMGCAQPKILTVKRINDTVGLIEYKKGIADEFEKNYASCITDDNISITCRSCNHEIGERFYCNQYESPDTCWC